MLTCETCGEVLPEGSSFCPNCGAPIEHAEGTVQPDTPDIPAADTAIPDAAAPVPEEAFSSAPDTDDVTDTESQFQQPQAAPVSNPYAMPSAGFSQTPGGAPEQNNSYPGTYPTGGNTGYGYGTQPVPPQSQPQQPYYGQQPQQNYGQPGNGGYIPPQQPGYPGGYPGYPQQRYPNNSSNGKATAGMVLGILSIVFGCVYGSGLIFGIIGLILSCMAQKEIKRNPLQNQKSSAATSGLICSIIGIVISVIFVLVLIIAVAVSVDSGDYVSPDYYDPGDYQDACRFFFGAMQ